MALLSAGVTEIEPGASRNRSLVGGIVGRVAPAVMRQIDTQDLVESLDVNLIAQELDLDRLVDRLDVNAIADRLDLDKLVARLDVNAIADRLDLDALVDRMDEIAIAAELDMAKLTAGATGDVAVSGLDLARRQLIRVDATVEAVSDRVLRRGHRRPVEPGTPEAPTHEDEEADPNELQRQDVSGHYAGPVTNGLSVVGDIAAVAAAQAVIAWGALVWFGVVLDFSAGTTGRWLTVLLFFCVAVAWYWIPVALFGRTLAMAVMGVAVVTRDGGIVRWKRSLVRALVLPFSIVLPIAFIGLLVGKERRALHDVVAGTVVVYDWGDRDAERPVTIRDQFSAQARRRADKANQAA